MKNFNNRDDFFKKILVLLQENLTVFAGNSDDFCIKVWWSLQEHLTIFQENLMIFAVQSADSYFQLVPMFFITIILVQAKLLRFCYKYRQINSQIFLKNLSNFSANTVKLFWDYLLSNFSVKIINFPHKNCQNFPPKIIKFSCKTCQIFV